MKSQFHETICIHGGKMKDKQFGALATPIYQTSTFVFDDVEQGQKRFMGEDDGYIYGRLGNPTVRELELKIAELEAYEDAAATGSGMGAVSAAIMAFVSAGDHIITSEALYGCSYSFLKHLMQRFGVTISFVDMTEPENIVDAIQKNTKMIYFETPINPHLKVIDISAVTTIAKKYRLKTIMDNTFSTPLLQKPSAYEVDLVIHSATKFLNGHGDVLAGIIAGSKEDITCIKSTTLKDIGAIISPHDAWLIIRGMKTLSLRMERHCQNAQLVAEFLLEHPMITEVYFPFLKQHPQYELAKRQMKAGGAVIAFEVKGGYSAGVTVLNYVKLASLAVSLGDAETLIQHPASMTHSTYSLEERESAGISESLIRLAVGLEHVDDIISDLNVALNHIKIAEKHYL